MAEKIGQSIFGILVLLVLVFGCACLGIAYMATEDSTIRTGLAVSGGCIIFCLFILVKVLTHPPAGVEDGKAETESESDSSS